MKWTTQTQGFNHYAPINKLALRLEGVNNDGFRYANYASLYYTGRRWLMWVPSAGIVAEPTEYTNPNDPPKDVVEFMVAATRRIE